MAPPHIEAAADGVTPEQERVSSKLLWRIAPFHVVGAIVRPAPDAPPGRSAHVTIFLGRAP